MPRVEWQPAEPLDTTDVAALRQELSPPVYFLRPPDMGNRPVCDFCSYEGRPVYLIEGEIYATICGFIIKSEILRRSMPGDWALCRGCQARCRIKDGDSWVPLEVVKRVWLQRQKPMNRYYLRKFCLPFNSLDENEYIFLEI